MASKAERLPDIKAVGGGNGSGGEESRTRRFGAFEVDLRAGELRRNGLKVKLQEQPLQVLTLLLERPGEVISRDDLRNRLWPADTFVDFDHSLNAAIRRLRDALGDSAENPRFVETVARRGYRFVAPVDGIPTNGGAAEAIAPAVIVPRSRHIRVWWLASGAAAIVLVLVGLKLGLLLGQHPAAQIHSTRLTANPDDDRVRTAAISRDGKYLAFADETGFYLRQIDTGETHNVALPQSFLVHSASWFPDSVHMVVSLAAAGQMPSLWEISVLGGAARKLSDEGYGPAVSPDGAQVAFLKGREARGQIWVMAADGAEPRKLAGEQGDMFGSLAWSPTGDKVAYTRAHLMYGHGIQGVIEVLDLKAGQQPYTLLSAPNLEGALEWTADNRLIYTLIEMPPRQSESNLWSVALNRQAQISGTPTRLTNDAGVVARISVSSDGKRLALLKGVPQPDVYVAKLEEHGARISEPQRLTLDDRQDFPFDWTRDGKAVIFASDRTGAFNIYSQAIDQTVPELLVGGKETATLPRLSPDGSQLLYLIYPGWGETHPSIPLMRVPLAGGTPQRVLTGQSISNHQCSRMPATVCVYSEVRDHELVFFTFDPLEGKGAEIFTVNDDVAALYNWSLSPDGTRLAIAKGKLGDELPRIRLVTLHGGHETWLTVEGWPGVGALDWAADGKSLWVASAGEEGNALLNVDLQGHVRPIWRPKKMTMGWAIPSRDGRYLALRVASGSANVWMLENF
jgi:DNA-binding winged helix-turn-helix (wHTH) protein/Tol biopolymer transport system component